MSSFGNQTHGHSIILQALSIPYETRLVVVSSVPSGFLFDILGPSSSELSSLYPQIKFIDFDPSDTSNAHTAFLLGLATPNTPYYVFVKNGNFHKLACHDSTITQIIENELKL